jgi:hypothetical protein
MWILYFITTEFLLRGRGGGDSKPIFLLFEINIALFGGLGRAVIVFCFMNFCGINSSAMINNTRGP